jgi:hypothetical protein
MGLPAVGWFASLASHARACSTKLLDTKSNDNKNAKRIANVQRELIFCLILASYQTGVSGINRDNFPYRAIGGASALYDL